MGETEEKWESGRKSELGDECAKSESQSEERVVLAKQIANFSRQFGAIDGDCL
jgi:hypothetical protein